MLYRYEITLDRVLDLTNDEVRDPVGVGIDVLSGPDWTACQELGTVAHALGAQGLMSPSATGEGDVLAVFLRHVGLGRVEPELVEEWHSTDEIEA